MIQVLNSNDNSDLGYISKTTLNQAQYAYTSDVNDALIVDFTLQNGATSATGIDLITEVCLHLLYRDFRTASNGI